MPAFKSSVKDWAEMYHPMFRLLFDLGFLGCRPSGSDSELYFHDQEDLPDSGRRPVWAM